MEASEYRMRAIGLAHNRNMKIMWEDLSTCRKRWWRAAAAYDKYGILEK